jgi:hypothetical protein
MYHLNVRDQEGNILESGVSYTVYTAGTNTAATIYGDSQRTSKTNPVTTTVFATDKGCRFWAATATVDIRLEYNGQRVNIDALAPGSEHNVIINTQDIGNVLRVGKVFEFDCAETPVTNVIIPAADNPNGILITSVFGYITEAMVGSSEDQGIVTVSDESDNAICTLTPSDGAADAIGDYILGLQTDSTATGTAHPGLVAAGEYVDAIVTQATAGTPAGKYKVYVLYVQL